MNESRLFQLNAFYTLGQRLNRWVAFVSLSMQAVVRVILDIWKIKKIFNVQYWRNDEMDSKLHVPSSAFRHIHSGRILILLFVFFSRLVPHVATTIILGDNFVESATDYNNYQQVIVTKQLLLQPGILRNISCYIVTAVGQLTLGIYNSSDASGSGPGWLRAATTTFVPVVGWNTVVMQSTVVFPAGYYWYEPPFHNNVIFHVSIFFSFY